MTRRGRNRLRSSIGSSIRPSRIRASHSSHPAAPRPSTWCRQGMHRGDDMTPSIQAPARSLVIAAIALVLAGATATAAAQQRRGDGGGARQVNNVHADARSRDVRNTSVNNVSSHRNVNVNQNTNVNVNV